MKNLKLSDLVVMKPWGYEYLIYNNADIAAWVLHFKKNAQTSLHAHKYKKTSLVVLEGKILFKNLNNSINLKELDVVLIEKSAFHQSQNISSEEAIILELDSLASDHFFIIGALGDITFVSLIMQTKFEFKSSI